MRVFLYGKWVAVTVWIGAEGEEDEGKANVEIFKFDSEEDAKLFEKKMLPVSPFYDGSAVADSTDPRGGTQVCVLCVSDDDLNKIYSVKEALESFSVESDEEEEESEEPSSQEPSSQEPSSQEPSSQGTDE